MCKGRTLRHTSRMAAQYNLLHAMLDTCCCAPFLEALPSVEPTRYTPLLQAAARPQDRIKSSSRPPNLEVDASDVDFTLDDDERPPDVVPPLARQVSEPGTPMLNKSATGGQLLLKKLLQVSLIMVQNQLPIALYLALKSRELAFVVTAALTGLAVLVTAWPMFFTSAKWEKVCFRVFFRVLRVCFRVFRWRGLVRGVLLNGAQCCVCGAGCTSWGTASRHGVSGL